jgi:hypothetical protein
MSRTMASASRVGLVVRAALLIGLLIAGAACASIGRHGPASMQLQLTRAKTLVSIGCYACLGEAVQIYEHARARGSANRTSTEELQLAYTLMAFREHELGFGEGFRFVTVSLLAAPDEHERRHCQGQGNPFQHFWGPFGKGCWVKYSPTAPYLNI